MKRNAYPACDTCCDCPPCPSPEFLCAVASASKTKEGYYTFEITTPPKLYRRLTYSGTVSAEVYHGDCESTDYFVYTITYTQSGYADWGGANTSSIHTRAIGPSDDYDNTCSPISGFTAGCYIDFYFFNAPTVVTTATKIEESYTGCKKHYQATSVSLTTSGTLTRELSNEYTTAQVRTDMIAAIAEPGDLASCSSSAIIASYSLSSDELTASGKKGKYGWQHPVPPRIPRRCDEAGGGPACFRITWDRTFTPVSGAPEVTPMTYTWDGVTPSGYNPADKTTWPRTTEYTEDVPTTPGVVTISNVQFFCTGCT